MTLPATEELVERAQRLLHQFTKFGVIGVFNTALFYTLYLLFLLVIEPAGSYYLAYILSMVFAVLMNLRYTFEKRATARKIITFVGVYLLSMYLGGLILELFISWSIKPSIAGLLTIGVTVITNFLGLKAAAKWA